MTVVVVAGLTIISYVAGKICRDKVLNISAAATDYFYPLGFKHILGTLSHIAGKHDDYSHLFQHRGDAAFATTSFR